MDKLSKKKGLENYTFVSHTDSGHVTRNSDIRYAGEKNLRVFIRDKLQESTTLNKKTARQITNDILRQYMNTKSNRYRETGRKGVLNIVFREVSVLGFDEFWSLLISDSDVKNNTAVLSLNLNPHALKRFEKGINILRQRFYKSIDKRVK